MCLQKYFCERVTTSYKCITTTLPLAFSSLPPNHRFSPNGLVSHQSHPRRHPKSNGLWPLWPGGIGIGRPLSSEGRGAQGTKLAPSGLGWLKLFLCADSEKNKSCEARLGRR